MRQDLGCMEYKKFQKQMRKHGVWKLTNWEEVMLESWKNKGGRGQWLEGIAETKSNGEIEFFTGDF